MIKAHHGISTDRMMAFKENLYIKNSILIDPHDTPCVFEHTLWQADPNGMSIQNTLS